MLARSALDRSRLSRHRHRLMAQRIESAPHRRELIPDLAQFGSQRQGLGRHRTGSAPHRLGRVTLRVRRGGTRLRVRVELHSTELAVSGSSSDRPRGRSVSRRPIAASTNARLVRRSPDPTINNPRCTFHLSQSMIQLDRATSLQSTRVAVINAFEAARRFLEVHESGATDAHISPVYVRMVASSRG
jgi:hypothetical protein